MPIHAHYGTERLEPEGMGEAAQQLVAAIMMDDRLADQRAEMGHRVSKPLRDAAAVQRKVGRSGFIGHQLNCPGRIPRQSRTKLKVPILFPRACARASAASSVSCRCHGLSGSDK